MPTSDKSLKRTQLRRIFSGPEIYSQLIALFLNLSNKNQSRTLGYLKIYLKE
ncbi:MAG: hypothetical protein ACFFCL_06820 [Promethearchaeota archaeon]